MLNTLVPWGGGEQLKQLPHDRKLLPQKCSQALSLSQSGNLLPALSLSLHQPESWVHVI
jgi:hypothetical protein